MQTNNFISYLTTPESISQLTENGIQTLVNQFPFCQTGQTLNTLYLNNNNSLLFDEQLKRAAIYSSDRKRLFDHLNSQITEIETPDIENKVGKETTEVTPIEIVEELNISTKEIDSLEKNYISAAVSSSFLLEAENVIPDIDIEKAPEFEVRTFNEDEAHSFKDWLLHLKGEDDLIEKVESISNKKKIHLDVIDKFIQEDPKIKPKKSEFYSPINMARLSVVDDSDMVSETLALIYVEQGNYNNAISTYEKLSLKNPEKRSYFANQIKFLKQKIK